MEKNKTAMRELWEFIIEDKTIPFEHYTKIRNKIHSLFPKEEQQIIEAHLDGQSLVSCEDKYAEQYYKDTYESN